MCAKDLPQGPAADVASVYMDVLRGCHSHRAWKEAVDTINGMRFLGVPADSHHVSLAISVCSKAGEWAVALRVLDDCRADSSELPDHRCYRAALDACATAGQHHEAMRLLRRMDRSGVRPTARSFSAAAKACNAARDWQASLACFDELCRRGLRPEVSDRKVALIAAIAASDHHRVINLAEESHSALVQLQRSRAAEAADVEAAKVAAKVAAAEVAAAEMAVFDRAMAPDGSADVEGSDVEGALRETSSSASPLTSPSEQMSGRARHQLEWTWAAWRTSQLALLSKVHAYVCLPCATGRV